MKKNKAIFLDRDGVINKKRKKYVLSIEDFVFLPNVIAALKQLQDDGFILIIVTNQSPINRKLLTKKKLHEIHKKMLDEFSKSGVVIKKIYFCPHRPDENCDCRKPKPKMILDAIKEFKIDRNHSWFIGDSETDIMAAKSAKINFFKISEKNDFFNIISEINNFLKK